MAKKQIATLVKEPGPVRHSPWWWRKGHLALESHLALDGNPPLCDAIEGQADLVLHVGLENRIRVDM
jgi:hypothetical protein